MDFSGGTQRNDTDPQCFRERSEAVGSLIQRKHTPEEISVE